MNKWDDNNEKDFKQIKCENVDWVQLAEVRFLCWTVVYKVVNIWGL
jgi:hypothetical protein